MVYSSKRLAAVCRHVDGVFIMGHHQQCLLAQKGSVSSEKIRRAEQMNKINKEIEEKQKYFEQKKQEYLRDHPELNS